MSHKPSVELTQHPEDIEPGHSVAHDKQEVDEERAFEARGRDVHDLPRGYWYSPGFVGSYCAIGFSYISASGGYGLISPILSDINNDLGPSENIAWVSLVWLLTQAITYLIVGRLTDIFGRRWFFITGAALGLIGSIIGAICQTVNVLIGAMVFLGLGAGITLCYWWAIAELVPMKYRYLATFGIVLFSTPGNQMAAKLAYAFNAHTGPRWRSCFYFEIAAHAVTLACWYWFYRPPTFKMLHRRTRATQLIINFDWIGLLMFTGSGLLCLMGISWGGGLYPWKSAPVIGTIATGAAGLVVFILWENFLPFRNVEPFLPLHLFQNRQFMASTLLSGFAACNYYAFVNLWPRAVDKLYDQVQGDYKGTLYGLVALSFGYGSALSRRVSRPLPPRPHRGRPRAW